MICPLIARPYSVVSMRTAVMLLAAASMLFTACSIEESEIANETSVEHSVDRIRIASGSFTVGHPSPHAQPTGTQAPTATFGISEVQRQDETVVFTFFGEGVVNYVGRYVDEAVTLDSGATVDVPGTSILQLDLISAPSPERGTDRPVASGAGGGIVSVQTTDPADGVTQAFIGTSTDRPNFTVTTQQNPPALIVAVL